MGRYDLKKFALQFKNGDVKRSSAQIINRNVSLFFLIQTVSNGGCSRFVDDTDHIQSCNFACIPGSLSLRVIKIGRYGNDCFFKRLFQVFFCFLLDPGKDHRGQFLRSEIFFPDPDFHQLTLCLLDLIRKFPDFLFQFLKSATHQTFNRVDTVGWRCNQMFTGFFSHQPSTAVSGKQ